VDDKICGSISRHEKSYKPKTRNTKNKMKRAMENRLMYIIRFNNKNTRKWNICWVWVINNQWNLHHSIWTALNIKGEYRDLKIIKYLSEQECIHNHLFFNVEEVLTYISFQIKLYLNNCFKFILELEENII